MRISEVLGLTWEDVDLKTGEIRVVRQRQRHDYFDTPKTDTSTRSFYADVILLAYLRTLKAAQTKEEMRLGKAYQIVYEDVKDCRALLVLPKILPCPDGCERRALICVQPSGAPFRHTLVTHMFHSLKLNEHSFRHTHATRLSKPERNLWMLQHALVMLIPPSRKISLHMTQRR